VTEELADALSYGGQSSAMRMPQHAKNHMSSFLCEDANLVSCVAWRLKL
jgi:hypothetical protein